MPFAKMPEPYTLHRRWDTGYVALYMVVHLVMLYGIWSNHPFWVRHRHDIVTVDRICSFVALAQVRCVFSSISV